MFGPLDHQGDYDCLGGAPLGFHDIFQAFLIMRDLMELHPTSNAPGPASPDAIAALPKRKLDEKMLGPEGKGECSVCMDDVQLGDEVVLLPCSHWFHEACARAWLSEHNTCPVCRKGIESETPPPK
jgi:E3 ubiquitin-protein ligase RNF115/126